MFKLEMHTTNAAFEPNKRMEICAVLRRVVRLIDEGTGTSDGGQLRDENGNTVGFWRMEPDT